MLNDGIAIQEQNPKASSFKYDEVVNSARNIIQGRSSGSNYYIVVDRGNTRTIVFQGGKNNWTPAKNRLASVGAPSSATPAGDYSISGRGYSLDGALGGTPYTCYYWTNFLNNVYLFHSIPYYQGTWTVQEASTAHVTPLYSNNRYLPRCVTDAQTIQHAPLPSFPTVR